MSMGMRVQTQNRRGEWVPAIPIPIHLGIARWRRFECYSREMGPDSCSRRFWTLEGYRAHYALVHILALDESS